MPKRNALDQPTSIDDSVKHDRTDKGMLSSSVGAIPVDGHPDGATIGALPHYEAPMSLQPMQKRFDYEPPMLSAKDARITFPKNLKP